jgi:hypothetical protein
MQQPTKKIAAQLELFQSISRIQPLPREIEPKVIALLARLLHQHASRKAAVVNRSESGDE